MARNVLDILKFHAVLISNEHVPAMGAPMMGTLQGNDFVKRVFHFIGTMEKCVETRVKEGL
jgi:hypothetical protein